MQVTGLPVVARENSRLVALDALRSAAAFLGVVLHAAVTYMPSRMPGLVWPVHNAETHPVFDVLFWSLHAFRLPLFFVISGFLAEMQYTAHGMREFVAHRRRRVMLPYYLAVATILPLALIVWNFGWYLTGRCTVEQMVNPFVQYSPELQKHYFGSAHLWFLIDLFTLSMVYGVLRREWGSVSEAKVPVKLRARPSFWMPFVLACLSAWPLWGAVHVVMAHNNSFIPNSARCVYYGVYFVIGAIAYRRRDQLLEFTQPYRWHLLVGVAALAAFVMAVPEEITGRGTWLTRLWLTFTATLSAWLMIFGLLGGALRQFTTMRPAIRYLSDASYWVYLCHLPLVGLGQVALHFLDWSPVLKFALVTVTTISIGLVSYEVCIRYTLIGSILHGDRRRPGPSTAVAEPDGMIISIENAQQTKSTSDQHQARAA